MISPYQQIGITLGGIHGPWVIFFSGSSHSSQLVRLVTLVMPNPHRNWVFALWITNCACQPVTHHCVKNYIPSIFPHSANLVVGDNYKLHPMFLGYIPTIENISMTFPLIFPGKTCFYPTNLMVKSEASG